MAISATNMRTRYYAYIATATAQGTDLTTASTQADQIMLALFQAICDEIVANSELVPVTTDSGTAGSGIITGKVK